MPSDTSTRTPREDQISDSNVKIITPLKVRGRSGQPDSPRSWRIPVITILFIFFVASLSAGGFFFIRHVSKHPLNLSGDTDQIDPSKADRHIKSVTEVTETSRRQGNTGGKSTPVPPGQQGIEPQQTIAPEKIALERERAEKELAAFVRLKKALDEKGVSEWGGKEYEEMIKLSRESDEMLMDNAFSDAAERYAQAGKKAFDLIGSAESVFQKLVEEGRKAFADGNSEVARQKFRTALMIEPSNVPVRRNLERAINLDGVKRLIDSGKNHEEKNRFAFAHADYQEALKLDPESGEAQQAVNRVKKEIVGEQFQKLMSEGLTAFHNGNYQSARAKLLEAKLFRTDSREVQEALEQVGEAVRLEKIEKLRRKAMAAELAEDWEQALKSYLDVLKIDPNINFAVQGKERSIEQIRVAKRISFFLQNPDALESDPQLQNAILLIAEAEQVEPRGSRLNARLDELKNLVDAARMPVKVMIESDDITEVIVYKVGKLGRFTFREISLRPGVYTVVGSRNGYKDVRQKIIVKQGQKILRVTVICTNKV
jgi:tetratricopeptide (TPR) repeat protein